MTAAALEHEHEVSRGRPIATVMMIGADSRAMLRQTTCLILRWRQAEH
jgi:hypothetical protein